MNRQAIRSVSGGIELAIHVQPKAKRVGIIGQHNQRIRVAVSAPPEGGKANVAVIKLLADELRIPRRQVELIRGTTSRSKDLRVLGVSEDHVWECLQPPKP